MDDIDIGSFKLRQTAFEQKLDNHIAEHSQYMKENQEMFVKLMESTKANTDSISELTKATAGIVEVYTASQGAIKVGSAIGRFGKWLTGIAIIGVGFKWVWEHLGGPPFTS